MSLVISTSVTLPQLPAGVSRNLSQTSQGGHRIEDKFGGFKQGPHLEFKSSAAKKYLFFVQEG